MKKDPSAVAVLEVEGSQVTYRFPDGHSIRICPKRIRSMVGPADGIVLQAADRGDRIVLSSGMHGEIFASTMRMKD